MRALPAMSGLGAGRDLRHTTPVSGLLALQSPVGLRFVYGFRIVNGRKTWSRCRATIRFPPEDVMKPL